jgi:NAD(P)-dependent dehydrogenase (short-subunit alcohol dehydrogenase family)
MMEMLRTAQGRIINISSVSGLDSAPFLGPYASSKFALEAISDSLRVELAIWKIKVILIEPGDVATPMLDKFNQELQEYNQSLPERAWELYGPVFEWEKEIKSRGMQSQVVAQVVEKALLSSRPKARYMLGPEARIVRFLRAVPTPMRDWILLHRLP